MKTLFVSGTDTDVGKTVVCATLLNHAARNYQKICYVKPIQTGSSSDCDTVEDLTKSSATLNVSCGLSFKNPLSPQMAAHYQNSYINFSSLLEMTVQKLRGDFNIVEGAGGLMVPINDRYLMIDFIKALSIPCVLVVRSSLGTINHTLLSLEALGARQIPLWGVVMVGPKNRDNEESVKYYGRIKNFIALPWLEKLNETSLAQAVLTNGNDLDRFLSWEGRCLVNASATIPPLAYKARSRHK